MDHRFSEVQELLGRTARDFFAREFPLDRIREGHRSEAGYDEALWPAIRELGWTRAPFPEELGGGGGGLLDAALVIEEMGKGCCASPFTHSTAAGLALAEADPALARAVAEGEATAIPALAAPAGREAPAAFAGGGAVEGRALAVPWANLATHFLVATGDGDRMAVVEAGADGVSLEAMPAAGGEPLFAVGFEGAAARAAEGAGLASDAALLGAAASALLMLGLCERALDLAAEYAKVRVAFGQPIGSFQAISHQCANMAVDIEVGRYLCYRAAWLHGEGQPWATAARRAKAFMGDATARITRNAIQVHGGVGYVDDHAVQFPYRLGTAAAGMYGTAREHRRAVADALLG